MVNNYISKFKVKPLILRCNSFDIEYFLMSLTNMPENANKKGVVLELFQPNETNVFLNGQRKDRESSTTVL